MSYHIVIKMPVLPWASIAKRFTTSAAYSESFHTAASPPLSQANATVESPTSSESQISHYRRDAHEYRKPPIGTDRDGDMDDAVYVLTLLTDAKHHAEVSVLRRDWFPAKLLKVDAHVTLFHALPGSRMNEIRDDLARMVGNSKPFNVRMDRSGVFRMGKGVGIEMGPQSLGRASEIREGLRKKWDGEERGVDMVKANSEERNDRFLSEQDARKR